jgi:hypothetical protein
LRARGITYDTGFIRNEQVARKHFDPDVVRRELTIIRDDLHCNAVQVIGGDPSRLALAARHAAELGLEVWFSPYPLELTYDEILSLFSSVLEQAEQLRRCGAEVVFVTGVELSIMNRGFMPGVSVDERLGWLLGDPDRRREKLEQVAASVNAFLARAVTLVRKRFLGRITYASLQIERVDWTHFDLVSVELIRSAEVAHQFRAGVRALVAGDKPVAITGFGTATYAGPETGAVEQWRLSSPTRKQVHQFG